MSSPYSDAPKNLAKAVKAKGGTPVGDDWMDDLNEEEAPNLEWSHYQLAIFDFVENGKGNGVVEALAGSGKTVSLIEALNYTPDDIDVAYVAFNKHIAKELATRAPSHVHVSTLHSLGYANWRAVYKSKGKPVDNYKMRNLFKEYIGEIASDDNAGLISAIQENRAAILKLTSLLKATLLEPTPENCEYIADRYSINVNNDPELVYETAEAMWQRSLDIIDKIIDFDDMIFASAWGIVPCQKFDFLFVDEAQDLNNAQIQMVYKSVKKGGRVICCGDKFQSIMGFQGADTDAIPNLIAALSASTMPLSITYRCPIKVVQLAQRFVPHLEAAPDAIDGELKKISMERLLSHVKEGDMVLCRMNAPLVKPALSLITNGVKAVILGRDIGKGLVNLIDKIGNRYHPRDLDEFLSRLHDYARTEIIKLLKQEKRARAMMLGDQRDTINALSDGCQTVAQIKRNIYKIFDDDRKGVTFSSVHKAKGGEADNVFILNPSLMPHPMAESEWQIEQEFHIKYVAITRAKKMLYFVE